MKAIVLFSGGVDSTVILAKALSEGFECLALTFDYGQRHKVELAAAKKLASHYKVQFQLIQIPNTAFVQSALVGDCEVPVNRRKEEIINGGIPATYVPARNSIFLSYAMGLSEEFKANEIHYGANKYDWNAYPDCTPEYVAAFQNLINIAFPRTPSPILKSPLVQMDKKEIIALGKKLDIPFDMTFTCYNPTAEGLACYVCDSCTLRQEGLSLNGLSGLK